jgi:hypothetical protein
MILKVQIHTLDNEVEIELKKDQDVYRLLIIKSRNEFHKDPGAVWHGESSNEELIESICNLVTACYRAPHRPIRITILDGMLMSIHYRRGETELRLSIKEFEGDTNELLLLQTLLIFCKQVVQDETFDRYAATLDSYFR